MKQDAAKGKLVVAVRIRGAVNVRTDIKETLQRLNLKKVNNAALIQVNDVYLGMLKKCVNHIAYGEVDEPTLGKLVAKFDLNVDPKAVIGGKADWKLLREKMPMRLHPPKHGFSGVRLHHNQGGSLGYMSKSINELVSRMV